MAKFTGLSGFSTFAMLLFASVPCYGELIGQIANEDSMGDIRGVVVDIATGERLPGVNVAIQGSKRGGNTNAQGFYLIAGVPTGPREVVFSAVGYLARSIKVEILSGEVLTLDVKLTSRVLESKEVVVQGEAGTDLTERSVSVQVLNPQEVQRLPSIAGQQDILRSLQILPGITSSSDVSAKFYVRGGAGDQNLILLDGMKIYNPFHAFGLFSVLDPGIVKSTEVYMGAYPAGFGNRLSSVVNIFSRDGNTNQVAGSASLNFLSGKLELEGPIAGESSWLVSGRSSLFSGTINKLIPNPAPTRFFDLFFKGTAAASTGKLGFAGYASGDDIAPTDPAQPDYRWRSSAYSGFFSGLITDRLYVNLTTSYSESKIERLAKASSPVTPASSELTELTLRTEMTSYTEGETTFFEGFEFDFPQINDALYSPNLLPLTQEDSQAEFYFWARAEGTMMDNLLGFDLGLHVDGSLLFLNRPFFYSVQPRFTLSYHLSPSWLVKVAFGIYTQKLISVSNEDDLISLFDAWLFLPEALQPEIARHYVISLDANLTQGLASSLQLYRKEYPALTLYNPAKVFPDDPDYLNGRGLSYGAELLIRYSSSLIDFYASYGIAQTTVTQGNITYAPRYDRRHTIKTVGTVHLTDGLDFTLHWEYGTGYPYTMGAGYYGRLSLVDLGRDPFPAGFGNPVQTLGVKNAARLPDYQRLDAGLNYRLPLTEKVKANVGVSVVNLLNTKNIFYYDRETGKTDYMIPFFPTASLAIEF